MGFLKSLFKGKDSELPHPNEIAVKRITEFAEAIMKECGKTFFVEDGLEKQVLCCYCFGAIHVFAKQYNLQPPDLHAITLAFLHKSMGYSAKASASQAQLFIDSVSDPSSDNTYKAIMHRGIDGFLCWQNEKSNFKALDFKDVLRILKKHQIGQ